MGKIKYFFLMLLLLMVLSSVSATSSVAKINQPYSIIVPCQNYNCSSLNITIFFPNTSVMVVNGTMTNQIGFANYSITPVVFGEHNYILSDGANKTLSSFKATSNGFELDTQASIIYFVYFFLIIFFFFTTLWATSKLPASNTKDEDGQLISINRLKYLRMVFVGFSWMLLVAIMFLASNLGIAYLGETLFSSLFFVLFRIMLGATPIMLIIWLIHLFSTIADDRELKKLWDRATPKGRV